MCLITCPPLTHQLRTPPWIGLKKGKSSAMTELQTFLPRIFVVQNNVWCSFTSMTQMQWTSGKVFSHFFGAAASCETKIINFRKCPKRMMIPKKKDDSENEQVVLLDSFCDNSFNETTYTALHCTTRHFKNKLGSYIWAFD